MSIRKRYWVLFFCLQGIFPVTSQLQGKWLAVNELHTYSDPACEIMEFSDDTLRLFSLDSLHSVKRWELRDQNTLLRQYNNDDFFENKVELKDSMTLIKYVEGKSYIIEKDTTIVKKTIFENGYVKLFPTIINYPADSVLQKQYEFFFPVSFANPTHFLRFDKKLCSEVVKNVLGEDKCAYCKIEKVDNIYFIVYYYQKDKKKFAVPIKEINQNHLVVYGLEGERQFVTLHEIKEIKNDQKIFFNDE